jgi:hypothetical protein
MTDPTIFFTTRRMAAEALRRGWGSTETLDGELAFSLPITRSARRDLLTSTMRAWANTRTGGTTIPHTVDGVRCG